MGQRNNYAATGYQRNNVGQNHKLIEHIAQFPNQIVGSKGAEEYERKRDHVVNGCGDLLTLSILTEEVSHVDLAEHVPAENGGEREEEQRYGYEDVTFDNSSGAYRAEYYLRNMPYSTTLIPNPDANDNVKLRTPDGSASKYFAWTENEITVTAYAYSYNWKDKPLERETRLVVNIPLYYKNSYYY